MEYRTLGRTGVQVSRLCFGTMSFGGDADEATSAAMFRRCRDAGINFFDCADVYQAGRSEEILGRVMAGERDELVITTKVHFPMGPDVNQRGLSRRHIMQAVAGSLRRLATDRIDLYFVHGFDARTPIDETLRALDDLVHQGKVLYLGVSNWAAWQIAKALGISALHDLARFECIQPMYSLVKRQAEVEILPLALSEQVGVISYSPLGSGLLSGKYGPGGAAGAGPADGEPDAPDALQRSGLPRCGRALRGPRAGARRASGDAGRGVGHGAPGASPRRSSARGTWSSWRRRCRPWMWR